MINKGYLLRPNFRSINCISKSLISLALRQLTSGTRLKLVSLLPEIFLKTCPKFRKILLSIGVILEISSSTYRVYHTWTKYFSWNFLNTVHYTLLIPGYGKYRQIPAGRDVKRGITVKGHCSLWPFIFYKENFIYSIFVRKGAIDATLGNGSSGMDPFTRCTWIHKLFYKKYSVCL